MKIWLDTAVLDDIREAVSWGVVRGVTTNPTLIANAGVTNFRDHILRIIDIVQGPVSAEVVSTDWQGMVREAEDIAKWSPHVVVKIPTIIEGLKAMKIIREFATINATLIFSPNQGYMAAAAGATYISPFINRLDAVSQDGMALIEDLVQILNNYGWGDTPNHKATHKEIVAASIKTPRQVQECLLAGAHIATLPFSVMREMMNHPLTDIGLKTFLDDWARASAKLEKAATAT